MPQPCSLYLVRHAIAEERGPDTGRQPAPSHRSRGRPLPEGRPRLRVGQARHRPRPHESVRARSPHGQHPRRGAAGASQGGRDRGDDPGSRIRRSGRRTERPCRPRGDRSRRSRSEHLGVRRAARGREGERRVQEGLDCPDRRRGAAADRDRAAWSGWSRRACLPASIASAAGRPSHGPAGFILLQGVRAFGRTRPGIVEGTEWITATRLRPRVYLPDTNVLINDPDSLPSSPAATPSWCRTRSCGKSIT